MKDKKITILQILILVMIIVCILVAIILMGLNNNPEKTEIGQVNSTKQEVSNKPTETNSKNKAYIPNASDEEKIQRGYELYGNDYCEKSKYIVEKLKQGEWDSEHFDYYESNNHNLGMLCDEQTFYCLICGEIVNGPSDMDFELCSKCAEITNRCGMCGKLMLNEEEYKLSWEDFKNKENILECTQSYIKYAMPEDDGGELITNSLYITEDYYIYQSLNYTRIELL